MQRLPQYSSRLPCERLVEMGARGESFGKQLPVHNKKVKAI